MNINGTHNKKHFVINVGNGVNFKASLHPVWGMDRGVNDHIQKYIVNNFKVGDILWFCTNKGQTVGMGEYKCFFDKKDEPLIKLNTYESNEQNWIGEGNCDIQIHYINFYDTQRQDIKVHAPNNFPISIHTSTCEDKSDDLYKHYEGFKMYGSPKF